MPTNENTIRKQQQIIEQKKKDGRTSVSQGALEAAAGIKLFPTAKYKLNTDKWNAEILKVIEEYIKKDKKADELFRHKQAYIKYLVKSSASYFKCVLSAAPFPNWFLNWGMITWQPDLVRCLLPPFFRSDLYGMMRILYVTNMILKKHSNLFVKDEIDNVKCYTAHSWEQLRLSKEVLNNYSHVVGDIASPILAEFLLIEKQLRLFPFVPIIIPLFKSIDLKANNEYAFALDLSQYLSPETHLVLRYTGAVGGTLGLLTKAFSEIFQPLAQGDYVDLAQKIMTGIFGIATVGADLFIKKGAGTFDAVINTLVRPEVLFMIKGPLLWRGSSAADWSMELEFAIPAIGYVDLEKDLDLNYGDYWSSIRVVTEEDFYRIFGKTEARKYYLALWTETIMRWFVLPWKRYKQTQMFGWMCGFVCYLRDSMGRELYYWGVPNTWGDITFTVGEDGSAAPQEFRITVSGTSMIYGDVPDLEGLISTLASQSIVYMRTK